MKLNQTVSMYHQSIFWDCFALQKLRILLLEVISVWRYPKSERNRIQDFFRYKICPLPVPRHFSTTTFFRYDQTNEKLPVLGIPGTSTSHSAVVSSGGCTFQNANIVRLLGQSSYTFNQSIHHQAQAFKR